MDFGKKEVCEGFYIVDVYVKRVTHVTQTSFQRNKIEFCVT